MKKSSLARFFFAFLAAVAIACTPSAALGQHLGHGSHGGGFHGGGSHGGGFHGGSHGHSFHGLGHSGGGGHSHIFGGGHQFHNGGGGRGLFSGRAFHSSNYGNFSSRNFGGGMHTGRAPSGGISATPFNNSRRAFSSGMFRNSGSAANGQWRSFGSRYASFGRSSGASTFSGNGGWRTFGNRDNPFATARGQSRSWQGSGWRSWGSQSERTSTRESGWTSFSRDRASGWDSTRRGDSPGAFGAWPRERTSAISTDRVLSNFETRFSHSPARRFSFANSRFGSRSLALNGAGFGDRHSFHGGEGGFGGREFWSNDNGDALSLLPDLFGLALGFGNFALRGFNFLVPGLDLLASAFGGDAGYGGSGYDDYGAFGGYGDYNVGFAAVPPPLLIPGVPLSSYWPPAPIAYSPPGGVFFPR